MARLVATVLMSCVSVASLISQGNEDWTRSTPPVRIAGNVYYVGTYDLSSYLITTDEGHILINTGLASSAPQIRRNVEALGFRFADIRLLMATHAHWDHVAALAEIKKATGARMAMHEADAGVLESGGKTDFRWGSDPGSHFAPVTVDQRLKDGDVVRLGGTAITVHHHPGHTRGASSFALTVRDGGRDYRVVIANMGSINPGVRLTGTPSYPGIAEDYARTFRAQRAMPLDIFLASHASQFGLHRKHVPGAPHDPARFMDVQGFREAVARLERVYLDQLEAER
jgi:metallo-beta-lactamase class B